MFTVIVLKKEGIVYGRVSEGTYSGVEISGLAKVLGGEGISFLGYFEYFLAREGVAYVRFHQITREFFPSREQIVRILLEEQGFRGEIVIMSGPIVIVGFPK